MMGSEPGITIVGLGPGDPDRRTVAAQAALDRAERLYLRTADHPGIDDLTSRDGVVICDRPPLWGPGTWAGAVQMICDEAERSRVVLAVPGHPRYGERIAIQTIAEARRRGIAVDVIDGLSVLDLAATALDIDPMVADLQIVDARQLADALAELHTTGGSVPFTPLRPLLFSRIHNAYVTAWVSRALARVFPFDHPVMVVEAAGIGGQEKLWRTTVGALADVDPAPLTSLWVEPLGQLDAVRDARTFQYIVARLRAPDGCPWDRKQTNPTLRDALVDEVYEAVDAIDAGDMDNLAEELGDLFLLIAMHAQIAEEAGQFTLEDAYEGIATKIVRRHPHVFGDEAASHAEEVVGLWQRIKAEEQANGKRSSKAADGQPHSMPALERAKRVLKKHPIDAASVDGADPGDRLLAGIAGIIDAGDDPDAVVRAALERHVKATEPPNP